MCTSTCRTAVAKEEPVSKEATPKIRFQAHSLLTRETLGSRGRGGRGGGPFAPARPSSPFAPARPSPSFTTVRPSSPFAPARPSPLSHSITSKSVTTSSPQVKPLQISLSSTMVQLPQQPSESTGKATRGTEEYSFSPGKIISTPPVQEMETSGPSFMFSPPLTRSAARKKATEAAAKPAVEPDGDANHPDSGEGTQKDTQSKPLRFVDGCSSHCGEVCHMF